MDITKPTDFISSHKQWSLDPSLTEPQISEALPGMKTEFDGGESGDGKVVHEWMFLADGVPCAIWDFKGARWSAYGPRHVFEALGLPVVGT